MKKLIYLFSFLVLFLLNSCITDSIEEAVKALDRLEIDIKNSSGDIKAELENWQKDLPNEVRSLIDDDIQKLSANMIGSIGAETRCNVDFLRNRFIQSVENIKRKLLKEPPIYLKPCFCTIDLPSINPNAEPKSLENLKIYGYDFDSPDPSKKLMQVVLIGDGNLSKIIDEKFVGRTTNYEMTINITDILPEIASNKYHKIKFFWNGDSKSMAEILIMKWQPQNLIKQFLPRNFAWYPPHTGGDCDLDTKQGNWANGKIQIQFRINGNELQARLFYDVMEFGGDNTRFGVNAAGEASAWGPWNTLYTNDNNDYELVSYSPAAPDRYSFSVTDQGSKDYYQAGSAVSEFVAYIDRKGDDCGYCHVEVFFNNMDVILRRKQPR
jgi:hypothetical protein